MEKEVSFSTFLQNPAAILGDPNLVFKIGDRYMNWQAAAPALVSFVVYKQQLTKVTLSSVNFCFVLVATSRLTD